MASHDSKLSFLTLNVQGLRKPKIRKSLFRTFKLMNIDVAALQESYLIDSDLATIQAEWGGICHLSAGTKQKKGLITLFNHKFKESDVELIFKSDRILTSQLSFHNDVFIFTNVYSPSDNDINKILFLNTLYNHISNIFENEDVNADKFVLLGDFNSCLNNSLDIVSGNRHSERVVSKFNEIIDLLGLIDHFRFENPFQKTYTWTRKKRFEKRVSRRLDYNFVSESFVPFLKSVEIKSFGFSDHRAVISYTDFSTFKLGPSSYKMNKNLLKNIDYVNKIKSLINEVTSSNSDLNPILIWELFKAQVRSISMSYSRYNANKKSLEREKIEKELAMIEKEISNGIDNDFLEQKLFNAKQKLELFLINESKGAQIRAGLKYMELGEKCTKYFLNLEKHRSLSNTIFKLKEGSKLIETSNDILNFTKKLL